MRIYGSAVLYYMLNELLTIEQVILIGEFLVGVGFVIAARHIDAANFYASFL